MIYVKNNHSYEIHTIGFQFRVMFMGGSDINLGWGVMQWTETLKRGNTGVMKHLIPEIIETLHMHAKECAPRRIQIVGDAPHKAALYKTWGVYAPPGYTPDIIPGSYGGICYHRVD